MPITISKTSKMLLVLASIIGIMGIIKYLWFNYSGGDISVRTQTDYYSEEFSIIVSSEADFITIAPSSFDYDTFNQWVEYMGVPSNRRSFYILEESKRVVPKRVNIVFKDISTLSQEEQENLFNPVTSNNKIVVGFQTVYDADDPSNIEFQIFQSEELYLNDLEDNYLMINTERANREVFGLLFNTMIGSRYSNNEQYQQARSKAFSEQTGNSVLFSLGDRSSQNKYDTHQALYLRIKTKFVGSLEDLHGLLVKDVYAQCDGSYLCGVEGYDCQCTMGGGSVVCTEANQGDACGAGYLGTCSCHPVCYPIPGDVYECGETASCSPSCGSLCDPDYDNCSYIPPNPSTPSPTLATTPPPHATPTPGGVSSCGCCDAGDWDPSGGCTERNGVPGLQCCCGDRCYYDAGGGSCLSNPGMCPAAVTTRRVIGRVVTVGTTPAQVWQNQNYICNSLDPYSNVITILNSSGNSSNWGCNPDAYYEQQSTSSGPGPHTFTLVPPAGYTCSAWEIGYPTCPSGCSDPAYNPPIGAEINGTGCVASVYLGPELYDNHLTWHISPELSCSINPSSYPGYPQTTSNMVWSVNPNNPSLYEQFDFTITNNPDSGVASFDANSDQYTYSHSGASYNFPFYLNQVGDTEYTIEAISGGAPICTATGYISVKNTPGWWQVYGGSIWANNGSISSQVPPPDLTGYTTHLLNNLISGTQIVVSKGVASATDNIYPSTVSSPENRKVDLVNPVNYSRYDFAFFANKLGNYNSNNAGGLQSRCDYIVNGYEVCHSQADIEFDGANFRRRKVILLVENDLTISGNINLDRGIGFFMAIVGGSITIADTVGGNPPGHPANPTPTIEGLFFAQNDFIIESGADENALRIRGSIVARDSDGSPNNGIVIRRSLPNNTVGPATVFEYAPDLILRYPRFLTTRSVIWRETAP